MFRHSTFACVRIMGTESDRGVGTVHLSITTEITELLFAWTCHKMGVGRRCGLKELANEARTSMDFWGRNLPFLPTSRLRGWFMGIITQKIDTYQGCYSSSGACSEILRTSIGAYLLIKLGVVGIVLHKRETKA